MNTPANIGDDNIAVQIRNADGTTQTMDLSNDLDFNAIAQSQEPVEPTPQFPGVELIGDQPESQPEFQPTPQPQPQIAQPDPQNQQMLNRMDQLISSIEQQNKQQQQQQELATLNRQEAAYNGYKRQALEANDTNRVVQLDSQLMQIALKKQELMNQPTQQPNQSTQQNQPTEVPKTPQQLQWEADNAHWLDRPGFEDMSNAVKAYAVDLVKAGYSPSGNDLFSMLDTYKQNYQGG